MEGEERLCVVTGGRGFAARHLVEMLIRYDMFSVRISDLAPSIKLEPHEESGTLGQALKSGRATYVSADLRDKSQLAKAFEGAEVVFHMAAPDSSINNYQLHHSVNVQGAKNVIDACVEQKVKRLIYTSSASVVFDGVHGIINGDESLPYPVKHNDSYSSTKAEGEALIVKANGTSGLLTCALRPSSIFGPGDRLFVPSLVSAARAGKLKFIIGGGNNMYDCTYVENVAHAHICAERALASEGPVAEKAAGQAYFITNKEPIKFWEFVSLVLEGLGYQRPRFKLPLFAIMPLAILVEWMYKLLGPYGMPVPQFTPSRMRLLSCNRTFNCSKANDLLGYAPIVTLQDAIKVTVESYSHLRAEVQPRKDGPSKASKFLGGGRVADTLLWRNKKQTLIVLLVLAAIYFSFIASGSTIITAASKLLLVVSVFLFINGKLPERVFGCTIDKVPESKFYVSEEISHHVALSVASRWNSAVNDLKSICRGNDWILFFKVVFFLLILSILGAFSLHSLFIIGLPFAFVTFYTYEKKEEEIDNLVRKIVSRGCKLKSDIAVKVLNSKKQQ